MELLHLKTKNDVNGNPRRLYVALLDGVILGVVNEGYQGSGAIPEAWKTEGGNYPLDLDITPGQYQRIKRQYGV